jgi:hypothetical protein
MENNQEFKGMITYYGDSTYEKQEISQEERERQERERIVREERERINRIRERRKETRLELKSARQDKINQLWFLEEQLETLENSLQNKQSVITHLEWKLAEEGSQILPRDREFLLNKKTWFLNLINNVSARIIDKQRGIAEAKIRVAEQRLSWAPSLKAYIEKEKRELQEEVFAFQEKARLDSRETERLSKRNKELEEENQALLEQIVALPNEGGETLEKQIQSKQDKLTELKSVAESKLAVDSQKATLETLLISQKQIARLGDNNSQLTTLNERQLQRTKDRLKANLSEEEINEICQVQTELIKLKMELERKREQQFEAHTSFPPRS